MEKMTDNDMEKVVGGMGIDRDRVAKFSTGEKVKIMCGPQANNTGRITFVDEESSVIYYEVEIIKTGGNVVTITVPENELARL